MPNIRTGDGLKKAQVHRCFIEHYYTKCTTFKRSEDNILTTSGSSFLLCGVTCSEETPAAAGSGVPWRYELAVSASVCRGVLGSTRRIAPGATLRLLPGRQAALRAALSPAPPEALADHLGENRGVEKKVFQRTISISFFSWVFCCSSLPYSM